MALTLVRPGRRLLTTAAGLMLVTATLHTIGFLSQGAVSKDLPAVQAMSALRSPMGLGMSPSLLDVFDALAFTMSVMLVGIAVLNLVLASSRAVPDSVLRTIGWVNVLWVGGFVAVNWRYQVPPPLMSGVVIEVVLLAYVLMPQTAMSDGQ